MDCDKIRKIVINQVNPDDTVSQVVIYFNVDTGDQLTEKEAQQCPNIQSLEFSCAVICEGD